MHAIKHFLLALQFFSRIPVTGKFAAWVGFNPEMQARSLGYFPLVGWLIGLLTAGAFLVLSFVLSVAPATPWIAALFSTLFGLLLTGALHEDGLADLVDGLGGSTSKEGALEIMKDSRIGAYGVIALFGALLAKVFLLAALAEINIWLACLALFSGHVISRLMPVWVVRLLPYVGNPTQSKSSAMVASNGVFWLALFWTLSALALVFYFAPSYVWLGGLSVSLVGLIVMYRLISRRLGGYNGDALGAVQQICELSFYFGTLVFVPIVPL